MKKNICERSGCGKVATRKVRNGHRVCEDCYKLFQRCHKTLGHNSFFTEKRVGTIGGNLGVYIDISVRFV